MQHKSDAELITAADTLIAKPVESWTSPDVVEAVDLLIILSNQNVDDAAYGRFPALEAAVANAPVTTSAAALAKLLWIDQQPEPEERQDWEPAALESIRAFLSPKTDFVADLGYRMGSIIDDKQGKDHEPWKALDIQQEAVEALIAVSTPVSLAGVAAQVLLAIRHLLEIEEIAAGDERNEDLRELSERTMKMLELAAPILADIAGVDLNADFGAYYGTTCGDRQVGASRQDLVTETEAAESDTAPEDIPVNPWAELIAGYIAAPAEWWNDDRLSDAVLTEATCREWVSAQCNTEPPPSSEKFDAITQPICDLISAIMAAPVEGVVGARAKLRLLKTDDWDARSRTDFATCMQSILDGLDAVLCDDDKASEPALQEAA